MLIENEQLVFANVMNLCCNTLALKDTLHCPWLENLGLTWNENFRVLNVQNLVSSLILSFQIRPRVAKIFQSGAVQGSFKATVGNSDLFGT